MALHSGKSMAWEDGGLHPEATWADVVHTGQGGPCRHLDSSGEGKEEANGDS